MKSKDKNKKKKTDKKKGLFGLVGRYLEYRDTCCDIASSKGGDSKKTEIRQAKEYKEN